MIDQDSLKRPSAEKLKKHSFFKNYCEAEEEDDDGEGPSTGERVERTRISVWNLNKDGFELDPYQEEGVEENFEIELVDKPPAYSQGLILPVEGSLMYATALGEVLEQKLAKLDPKDRKHPWEAITRRIVFVGQTLEEETPVGEVSEGETMNNTVDREAMTRGLVFLRQSLEDERHQVNNLIGLLRGEEGGVMGSREEQLLQMIERMNIELENEKKKNLGLGTKLKFFKLQIYGASRGEDQA